MIEQVSERCTWEAYMCRLLHTQVVFVWPGDKRLQQSSLFSHHLTVSLSRTLTHSHLINGQTHFQLNQHFLADTRALFTLCLFVRHTVPAVVIPVSCWQRNLFPSTLSSRRLLPLVRDRSAKIFDAPFVHWTRRTSHVLTSWTRGALIICFYFLPKCNLNAVNSINCIWFRVHFFTALSSSKAESAAPTWKCH